MINKKIQLCAAAIAALLLTACGGSSNSNSTKGAANFSKSNKVRIWQLADPDMLNPVNSQGAGSAVIESQIFQTLLSVNPKTLKMEPQLADSLPQIEKTDSGMLITYTIRKQAKWDDGTPITAKDVAFSLKVIKCPTVNNPSAKPYYSFIHSVKLYPNNPRKITFVTNKIYILAESSSGGFFIIPQKIYDPKNILANYTVEQLTTEADKLSNDPKIIAFGKNFNSTQYQRYKGYIVGSGPYQFSEWQTGQKVVLEKKKNWWGANLENVDFYYNAYPEKLVYQTINDETGALVALKNQQLDVMGISPRDFKQVSQSAEFKSHFYTYTPSAYSYSYIGINTRLPKFSSVKTRQALAHLVDVNKIIQIFYYGYATPAIGPVSPNKKKFYNTSIKPYSYDPKLAAQMLKEDGWKDMNGDGILDKMINGQRVPFTIKFSVNSGNDIRKGIALLFQQECKQVGIKVSVVQEDWSIFLQDLNQHKFEMIVGGWVSSPLPSDPEQIFSTTSYNGGSNFVGFGNIHTDQLIDSIRTTLDVNKRIEMWKRFQVILHNQVSYIFLADNEGLIAISKRFKKPEVNSPYTGFPGYWTPSFQLQ